MLVCSQFEVLKKTQSIGFDNNVTYMTNLRRIDNVKCASNLYDLISG